MNSKLMSIESRLKTLKPEDRKTAVSCDSFLYAYGKNTTFDDIARRAGLVNLASKAGINGWQVISKEKIVEMDPDVIFLPSWSYKGFDAAKFVNGFKSDKGLMRTKAVKNNKVLQLREAHMTCVSHYIVLGVEDAAREVYPQLFD